MDHVLLVECPHRHAGEPALSLALLRGILQKWDIPAQNLFASLLYPRTATEPTFLDRYGSLCFAPWLRSGSSRAAVQKTLLERCAADLSLQGIRGEVASYRAELSATLPPIIEREIENAGRWLARATSAVLATSCSILGFSVTFESQLPATLALIERVKSERPELRIMLGGAACQEEQASGIMASFPLIDATCYCEGEAVIAQLASALAGQLPFSDVPGVVYRQAVATAPATLIKTPPPPLCRDLDALPMVEYDDYFAQLAKSDWHDADVGLLFETSRGCWWGQKHLCTFCGLNGDGLAFRAKSADRAYREIEALYRRYPRARYLIATDNIIARPYYDSLLPRLAAMPRIPGRPLHVFYEIKSNLKPDQVERLAAAGITTVQPGIESLSDHVLALMDKGCTALGQVQFIKWAAQSQIATMYNLLVRNPGETAQDYLEMAELIRSLHHLPPPHGLVVTQLERFSPYHRHPERYGLANLRPLPFYRVLFPDPAVDLDRIAYMLDFDHPIKDDDELRAAHRHVAEAVDAWRASYRPGSAYYLDRGSHLVIIDERCRDGEARGPQLLFGLAAELYRYLDRHRSQAQIERQFGTLDPLVLLTLLQRWSHQRIVYMSPAAETNIAPEQRRFLALLPRRGPAPSTSRRPDRTRLEILQ